MAKMHPWVKSEREYYKKIYRNLVKELDLSHPLSVLDYGAGTGGFASLLAEYNPKIKVLAVDSNPEAVKLGREHYQHLQNLEFLIAEKIPKRNYDLIFQNLVLHELNGKGNKKTITSFLKKSYNYLKVGGLISVLDNRKISEESFKPLYEKNKNPKKRTFKVEDREHNKYTMQDWKEMLERSGFYTEQLLEVPPNLFYYKGRKK